MRYLTSTLLLGVALVQPPALAEAPAADALASTRSYDYGVPLDSKSPWPKFRRNALQNGRAPFPPIDSGRAPWAFRTGKGVFSSPVVDEQGTVYVGSADHHFYAIDRDGALRWKVLTGEIIDSAALLDDAGRVIFGSGDGRVYALDRDSGRTLWTFEAEPPSTNAAFINWFEGNVAIGSDGTLYVPNDNFCTYALHREDGARRWCYKTWDQTWSLPAFHSTSGRLFFGNNFAFFRNVLSIDAATGEQRWAATAWGSAAASPLLTSSSADAAVVVGAFDGYVRAYEYASGRLRWKRALRDHVYASPGQLADGTIIQPGADGTIYALRPKDGSLVWAFDTREPIRSSPAIDGQDNVYVGSGDGRLIVLTRDGRLRWSLRLIEDNRDDLNASPALTRDGVILAGENGAVFSVPYDYCLRPESGRDPHCVSGRGEDLPDEAAELLFTTPFGRPLLEPPAEIDANQPLTFSLFVREHGNTQLALLDSEQLSVSCDPPVPLAVNVAGDGRFFTVVPQGRFRTDSSGKLTIRVHAEYRVDPGREALRSTGGRSGGTVDRTFDFTIAPRADTTLPLPIPSHPGEPAGVWELYRFAAPLPTILPSYNQIGFDSIHYLIGLVAGDGRHALGWAIGGRQAPDGNGGEVDPNSRVRFPLVMEYDGGLLTMMNNAGFTIEFNGWPLPFESFRVATRVDEHGAAVHSAAVNATATCGNIDFYGAFLQELGYCNPSTDELVVAGAADLRLYGTATLPARIGDVRFDVSPSRIAAVLSASGLRAADHNFGVLLVDRESGRPLPLDYVGATTIDPDATGGVAAVAVSFVPGAVRGVVQAYLMVDAYPAARATLSLPARPPLGAVLSYRARRSWHELRRLSARIVGKVALAAFRFVRRE